MNCSKSKSVLALLLSVAVFCGSCVLHINTVFADSVNIIKGNCPVIFGTSDVNSFDLNGNKVRFASVGNSKMEYGYDETDTTTKQFWSEKLSALTDGDNTTNLYIRPEKYSDDDRVVMVYRFGTHVLEKLKLTFDASAKKEVKIFASDSKNDLFTGEPEYTLEGGYKENDFEIELNNINASYFALVFEGAKYKVVEIELLGTEVDLGENIIKESIPSMYATANDGEFTYNWRQIHYGTNTTDKNYGYSEEAPDRKESWREHTAKLTDGNTGDGLYIRPENYGNSKRVVIVYELPELYNLSGFSIVADNSSKSYSVYVGENRSKIFETVAACTVINDSSTEISDGLSGKRAKYIGIVFETPDLTVNEISFYGNVYVPEDVGDSLLSDIIPTMYAPANEGEFTYNWRQILFSTNNADKMHGYSEEVPDRKENWKEHTVKLTDGDASSGLYMKPEAYGNSKRVIIVYELPDFYNLSTIRINADSSEKNYSVYAAAYRSDLFEVEPIVNVTNDTSYDRIGNLNGKKARYIGIVFETPNLTINEILAYGDVFVPDENNKSLIYNTNPSMYAAANEGQFTYNWRKVHYSTGVSNKIFGYSEDVPSTKESWNEHTIKLTDGDTDSKLYIKPEAYGESKRVVIVYDFTELYDLSEIKICADSSSKNYSVYTGTIRRKLFENEPVCTIKDDVSTEHSENLSGIRARYIGIVIENPDLAVNEISIFGDLFVPDYANRGENVLLGKTPAMYASAARGTYNFNWTMTAYDSNGSHYHGYTETDRINQREFWNTYTSNFTDGNEETFTYIAPEDTWGQGWVIAVYNIEDSYVNGFTVKTDSEENKAIQFFASSDRSSLFQNLLCEVETNKKNIIDDGSINVRAKYVAFVFQCPSYNITEISVIAEKYVREDYGTSLLEGKEPTTLYVADREYPLIPSGIEIANIDQTSKELKNLTDNDLSTTVCWTPWYSAQYPSKDSTYIVTAFDIGDMATLDTFRIDSALGGFDIYIADNSLDLFKSKDNLVYTSSGDKLTEDKSGLDSSTDLKTGEQVIPLGGAKGRFIGLVITRTAPTAVENWGNTYISEIELFGTLDGNNQGENLVSGTEPVAIYRADYDDYALSQGNMTPQAGTAAYTDGKNSISAIQFPNAGGFINYDNGLVVMVYYLQGNCDIKRVNIKSPFYYGIGGVDIYVSDSYEGLFEKTNLAFTTEGYEATDGIYELSKNLGSMQIPVYFDKSVSGRYIAFAFTRISDSNSRGWGLLRLDEIEVFGNRTVKEVLPDTTVIDPESGATATFNYQNPDEKFEFSDKGIASFKLVTDNSYTDDLFKQILVTNGYTSEGEPFKIEFLDKKGQVISNDKLAGENVTFKFKLKDDDFCFLGELINDGASVIKFAAKVGSFITYEADSFNKSYVFLKFNSSGSVINNITKGDTLYDNPIDNNDNSSETPPDYNQSDTESENNTGNQNYTEDTFAEDTESNIVDNSQPPVDGETNSQVENVTSKPQNGGKKWVVVQYDDPLEWFWNIYDTFAANPWMLIVCCSMLVLGIDSVVLGIVFFKRRRKT